MGRKLSSGVLIVLESVGFEGGCGGHGRDLGQQDTGQFCWQNLPEGASGAGAAIEHEVGGDRWQCLSSRGGLARRGGFRSPKPCFLALPGQV